MDFTSLYPFFSCILRRGSTLKVSQLASADGMVPFMFKGCWSSEFCILASIFSNKSVQIMPLFITDRILFIDFVFRNTIFYKKFIFSWNLKLTTLIGAKDLS